MSRTKAPRPMLTDTDVAAWQAYVQTLEVELAEQLKINDNQRKVLRLQSQAISNAINGHSTRVGGYGRRDWIRYFAGLALPIVWVETTTPEGAIDKATGLAFALYNALNGSFQAEKQKEGKGQ